MKTFDVDAFRRGHADHDVKVIADLYADDAVLEIVDATTPPSQPRRLEGKAAIEGFLEEIFQRDMDHEVATAFTDGDHAAIRVACRYPNGQRVLTSETCDIEDGRIVRETLVQAWDD